MLCHRLVALTRKMNLQIKNRTNNNLKFNVMKRNVFILMTLVVFFTSKIVNAQTSTTPYLGDTYSYSVTGIDGAATTRTAQIYFTNSAAPGTLITPGSTTFELSSLADNGGSITIPSPSSDMYEFTLSSGATQIDFNVDFGSGLTVDDTYRIWIKIFDTNTSSCSNMMFLNVVPKTSALDFAISASVATVCPATTTPTTEQTDAVDNTTTITYTVTRTGGNDASNWSFDLSLDDDQGLSETVTVSSTTNVNNSGSTYTIEGGTSIATVTVEITNAPGTADADFDGAISNMTQYMGKSTVVNSTTDSNSSNNSATTTLKRIPSIGGFVGN